MSKSFKRAPGAPSLWRQTVTWLRSPFQNPVEQRYVNNVLRKINRGVRHSTLGIEVRDEATTRAKAERWLKRMIDLGLKPNHLCVEYGCGSLWAAEPVIRYLEPGCFIGLDVADKFYELGRVRIGDLLREKQVRLGVISQEKLAEVAALQPDFLYSRKVLAHVPEFALPSYLRNVAALMVPKTIAALDNTPMLHDDGSVIGRRHTAEAMQARLPPGFTVEQRRFAAVARREA
jgi:hypothetical protein